MLSRPVTLALTALSLTTGFLNPAYAEQAQKSVAITQIVEHPALDAVRKGVKEELIAQGYTIGKNLKWSYESAQGNIATASQIAKKFAGEEPDVIVAIATPSAQTAIAAARHVPVIFSAVTDPLGAKLVKDLAKPAGMVSGVSDLLPIDKHLDLVKKIVPNVKKLGVIFNPGETNSVSTVAQLTKHANSMGIEVVESAATKSSDVLAAARALVGKVEAVYLPTDNTVVSAIESVIKVGAQNKLPIIAGDTDSVVRRAVAAVGFNYYDLGRQTGIMVDKVLKGQKAGELAVEHVQKLELFINIKAAKKMGVTIDQALIDQAKKVITE